MDSHLKHLILGTFLHDIGKVMQRADLPLSIETQNILGHGPTRDGRPTHCHVHWTGQFFEELFGNVALPEVGFEDKAKTLAFRHHNPSTTLQQIVAEADRLSSGMDRGEKDEDFKRGDHLRKHLIPLQSLLIHTEDKEPNQPYPSVPLVKLTSQNDSTYPKPNLDESEKLIEEYQDLWKQFLKDWQERPSGFDALLAYIDALYERYFWCVPASTIDKIPDSSLYEHSKTSTAIAGAMYLYLQENNLMTESAVREREKAKFLLVSGDLSGIQNYIFAIAHTGGGKVAKRLRARSFVLGQLTQILARKILDQVGLPFLNIITNAGGKFQILLPNTDKTKSILVEIEKTCQSGLRERFQGILSLNLAWVEMSGQDFFDKRVGEKFVELVNELTVQKHQPFRSLLIDSNGWNEENWIMPEAAIPKESPSGQYDIEGLWFEEDLGQKLPKAKCMALYDTKIAGAFPLLDWSFSVGESADQFTDSHPVCIISFDKGAESSYPYKTVPVHYEYRVNNVPRYRPGVCSKIDKNNDSLSEHDENRMQEDQILPYNLIAKASTGYETIAYLKADVDNLSLLLRQGLDWKHDDKSGWTLSKMATFSRSLEFFFSGRVKNLLREEKFKFIYSVFSGGDDLFLVGPWDTLHNFAIRLQEEWKGFVAGNPSMTLSVGITLARPMMPVWVAAHQAEEALEKAKKRPFISGKPAKDQLCAFGHVMKWKEVDAVFQEIERINQWLQEGLSTAFVRNLMYFSELARMYREEQKVEGLRYLPLLSYNVSRNIKNEEIKQWVENLKDADGDPIRHMGFIANYALTLNRGK